MMADSADPIEAALDEIDAEDGASSSSGLRRILPVLAAIVTLAAFGAIVWYAYSTGVREGSEVAAPLLKPSGPSKIAPRDRGGREILDRDKRVYGVIDGSAGGRLVERLLPPPENPLPPPVARKPAPVAKPPLATPKLAVPKPPPPPPSITAPAKLPPPPAKQATGAAPPPAPKPVSEPAAKPEPNPDLKPAAKPEVAAAPKPAPPPKPAPVVAKPVTLPKAAEPAPKPAQGKRYRVQIASLRTAEAAKREWAKRVKQSGGALAGLTLFVKRVDIPKRGTYFRVQAGPLPDKTAARRVCATLKQRKIGCLVVQP